MKRSCVWFLSKFRCTKFSCRMWVFGGGTIYIYVYILAGAMDLSISVSMSISLSLSLSLSLYIYTCIYWGLGVEG